MPRRRRLLEPPPGLKQLLSGGRYLSSGPDSQQQRCSRSARRGALRSRECCDLTGCFGTATHHGPSLTHAARATGFNSAAPPRGGQPTPTARAAPAPHVCACRCRRVPPALVDDQCRATARATSQLLDLRRRRRVQPHAPQLRQTDRCSRYGMVMRYAPDVLEARAEHHELRRGLI